MALPTGTLTRGTILDLALRKVGNTNASVRTDAGTWLDQILYDLYTQFTWPFTQTSTSFTLVGDFALPADFLQAVDDASLRIDAYGGVSGSFFLSEIDRETFERLSLVTTTGTPRVWTADRSASLGKVYPTPDTSGTATLRYAQLPAALTTDASVPVFPWHNWLVDAVYVRALEYETDPRADTERGKLEMSLARLRQIAFPLRSQASVLPLDPLVFGPMFDGDWTGSSR